MGVGTNMRSEVPADPPVDRATAVAFTGTIAARGETGMTPSMSLAAYNPITGQLVWQTEISKTTNSGNLVTAGDVVFQGVASDFYAFVALFGRQLLGASVSVSIS